ncbi:hypothetical protein B0H17DRAFT_1092740 [Mycena rosella]|uniref:Uncharacterized protein n=1 Tax=Mycena rosella TaxID=1033263 RepID=A0AAD7CTF6_MYCRO|nr:hypothetical protein B0H17DRAFT_1092740 [Mycena rosella]
MSIQRLSISISRVYICLGVQEYWPRQWLPIRHSALQFGAPIRFVPRPARIQLTPTQISSPPDLEPKSSDDAGSEVLDQVRCAPHSFLPALFFPSAPPHIPTNFFSSTLAGIPPSPHAALTPIYHHYCYDYCYPYASRYRYPHRTLAGRRPDVFMYIGRLYILYHAMLAPPLQSRLVVRHGVVYAACCCFANLRAFAPSRRLF